MTLDSKLIQYIAEQVKKAAKSASDGAGYGGRHDDGGSSRMLENLNFWVAGINSAIPKAYEGYEDQFEFDLLTKNNPEYEEFLRLQEKFKLKK